MYSKPATFNTFYRSGFLSREEMRIFAIHKQRIMRKAFLSILCSLSIAVMMAQQPHDKPEYRDSRNGYFVNTILQNIHENEPAVQQDNRSFRVDVSNLQYPNDPSMYTQIWHNDPVSQGNTGTCWCFSTTSFFESEAYRTSGLKVKLSEMYVVYWQYVERAKYYVEHHGNMYFGEGSETNGVTNMIREYGEVPYEDYHGITSTASFYNHEQMFAELDNYLKGVKASDNWNENDVVATVRSILNYYMGEPPTSVTYGGKTMSPQDFVKNVLKLDMSKYVDFMSLISQPFYTQAEYDVSDNWWNDKTYYNVPVDDFMAALKTALKNGYSVSIGGDVSEPGWDSWNNVGIVPSFDIPSAYIDDGARQMRFNNGSTTDDHAMHCVGYADYNSKTWFLFKDSGSGSRNCGAGTKSFGYYYVSEDYVKLKMMTFTVNKDAVQGLLEKFAMNQNQP